MDAAVQIQGIALLEIGYRTPFFFHSIDKICIRLSRMFHICPVYMSDLKGIGNRRETTYMINMGMGFHIGIYLSYTQILQKIYSLITALRMS